MSDEVNSPFHYQQIPGIEVIDVIKHFSFSRGSALKYLMRADYKGKKVEDLKKAVFLIQKEISDIEAEAAQRPDPESGPEEFYDKVGAVPAAGQISLGAGLYIDADGLSDDLRERLTREAMKGW